MHDYYIFVAKNLKTFMLHKELFPNGTPGKYVYVVKNELECEQIQKSVEGHGNVMYFNLEELPLQKVDQDPEVRAARAYLAEHESEAGDFEPESSDEGYGQSAEAMLPRLRSLVLKHCIDVEEKSLNDYAAMIGVTPNYLSTLFKKTLKQSFHRYVSDMKIERTKILVEKTTFSIIKIANLCNYKEANQYIRNFKSYVGVTPSEYRRRARQASEEKSHRQNT